jgi:hypothetical protein
MRSLIAAAVSALGLLACVAHEHAQVAAAQEAYDRCVAENSRSHSDCVSIAQRVLAAQQRYQENSRRAWACDPGQEQCPTPR